MSEVVVDDIVAVLPPLLQALEALGFIARHLNPPDFDSIMEAAGQPDQALLAVRPRLAFWPEACDHFRTPLETASDATPGPSASTSPAPSSPATNGSGRGYSPVRKYTSM
jgi:phospholipase/carboxylesterase